MEKGIHILIDSIDHLYATNYASSSKKFDKKNKNLCCKSSWTITCQEARK